MFKLPLQLLKLPGDPLVLCSVLFVLVLKILVLVLILLAEF